MPDKSRQNYNLVDRCAGAILGVAFGDALGASVEGWSAQDIKNEYGEVRDYIKGRMGSGFYSDDTQMTLATARSLVRIGKVDGADCAKSCAAAFDPDRGYGRSAIGILNALAKGADYTKTGAMLFPDGSFGNGAAMRIAPVGILLGNIAEPSVARRQVFEAVRATHTHEEAIDGALIVAVAVGKLSRLEDSSSLDGAAFLRELAPYCRTMEMRSRIMFSARLLEDAVPAFELIDHLGNSVRTLDSVPTALYTAMKFYAEPEQAIIAAVSYGGDSDTIAAMTGAVVGALNGAAAFPQRWHDGLERGADGYDALIKVSRQLSEMIM